MEGTMFRRKNTMAADLGLLALRVTAGGLMVGHGAQKLFGAFGGYGLQGTAGWLESLGLKPGKTWATMAGGAEFGSGVLMALGFLNPIGPISLFGPMVNAWTLAHAGKPIWGASGGAELPLTNMAIATAVALAGPGRYSLDEAFGIELPTSVAVLTAAGVAAGIAATVVLREAPPAEPQQDQAAAELQAQDDAG
jgi:putative oxidoreductase